MRTKRLITMLITVAMVLTLAVPAFATEDASTTEPAPVKLTSKQVKAITPKGVKAASYSYTKIKVTWNKIEGVDGYKVYRATSKNGKYTCFFTNSSEDKLQVINTGRTTGKTYYYKVRGYKKIGKTTYYTKYSAVTSTYARPTKVKISKVKCLTEPLYFIDYDYKVRVYWGEISGATGYQVYRKRTDKTDWKLFKTVSNKYTYATDKLLGKATKPWGANGPTYYDGSDLKYEWEYKVRAYRTVNGKKVYGSFSAANKWVPDWTIEEIYEEAWKYVESLKWPVYEYANPDGSENENGELLVPKKDGSTYKLKHTLGNYTFNNRDHYEVYTNPINGETKAPEGSDYSKYTPDNSSWGPIWPEVINPYRTKAEIMKTLKDMLRSELGQITASNPMHWTNAELDGAFGPNDEEEYWDGVQYITIYYEKYLNGYKMWLLW